MSDTKHNQHQPAPARATADARARSEVTTASLRGTPEELAQASIGAQIILDYNSDASKGARGGMAATVEENTLARDANLMALGLNPVDPTGPPSGDPWEPPVTVQAASPRHVMPTGVASKHSSLAAGITTVPTPPPPVAR